jgi:hypothetical protein
VLDGPEMEAGWRCGVGWIGRMRNVGQSFLRDASRCFVRRLAVTQHSAPTAGMPCFAPLEVFGAYFRFAEVQVQACWFGRSGVGDGVFADGSVESFDAGLSVLHTVQ